MKLVRIEKNGMPKWGVLQGGTVYTLSQVPYEEIRYDGGQEPLEDCVLLVPCQPGKIVCLGKNYYDHAIEMNDGVPEQPILFIKTPNCLNRPEGTVHAPAFVKRLDYEGELAFVIKKLARNILPADAFHYILGYTCLNDVTARDIQKLDGQWTRSKCMDGFAPMGPVLTDEVNPADLKIETRLNGKTVQSSTTARFMTKIPEMLAFITAALTLEPGDVVTTGTPAGIGPMVPGDTVEIEIEGIGVLRSHIV
ncbi:MAG: fumarylacetoacetate hydrolase family protein [Intestinimonas sp.]|nr:fumarylacetoacetate hydrolase family protein [Intestinimonas sp.]